MWNENGSFFRSIKKRDEKFVNFLITEKTVSGFHNQSNTPDGQLPCCGYRRGLPCQMSIAL